MTPLNKNKKLIIIGSIFVIIIIICISAILTKFKEKNAAVVKIQSKQPNAPELNPTKKDDNPPIKSTVPDSSQPIITSNDNKKSSESSDIQVNELSLAPQNNINEIKSKETKKNEKTPAHSLPLQSELQAENLNEILEKQKLESQKTETAQSALSESVKTTDVHKLKPEDKNYDKQILQEAQKLSQTDMEEPEKHSSNSKDQNHNSLALEVEEKKTPPQNEEMPQILAESLSHKSIESKKDKEDINDESHSTQINQSLDTDSVNVNSSNSVIIKSINHFDCGNISNEKICGSFEIHNLPTPLNEFPTMKVFFAVENLKIIQEIASEILEYDTKRPFDPSSILGLANDANGTTYYNSKDQDKNLEVDNLTLEIILDRIVNNDFITFFNSLKFEERNKWDKKNLFVIIPETLKNYSLTGNNWITKEQLSISGSADVQITKSEVKNFIKGYFVTSKYTLNTKIINNLFGQKDLKALSVEFSKANENKSDSQFNSLDNYNSLHPNNRRITYSEMNIMHNYELNDYDILTALEKIKANGLITEINKHMEQKVVKPFSILFIGSDEKINEFEGIFKINN